MFYISPSILRSLWVILAADLFTYLGESLDIYACVLTAVLPPFEVHKLYMVGLVRTKHLSQNGRRGRG